MGVFVTNKTAKQYDCPSGWIIKKCGTSPFTIVVLPRSRTLQIEGMNKQISRFQWYKATRTDVWRGLNVESSLILILERSEIRILGFWNGRSVDCFLFFRLKWTAKYLVELNQGPQLRKRDCQSGVDEFVVLQPSIYRGSGHVHAEFLL